MNKLLIRRTIISIILSIGFLVGGYWAMETLMNRESPVRQMSFRESKKPVRVQPIVYKSREIAISSLGKVLSENAIDLIAEVQGEIRRGSVPIKRGQTFRRGQILFRINSEEAKLTLFAQKSNFMTAVAGILPDMRVDYPEAFERWQKYFSQLKVEETLPDLPEIANAKEKVFLSTRNIINQFYTIKSAEERLSKYVVRAPFSGSFMDVLLEEGSVANPGSRVARIARSNSLELEVPIRKEDLEYVQKGLPVSVVGENNETQWKGRISRVGSIVDPTTQAVNVYIDFKAGADQVFEGQYLRAEIPGTRLVDVMEIPRKALVNSNQVYIVQDSNRLVAKDIQLQKINKETLYFTGIESGELVVVEPLFNAYENMPVSVLGDSNQPTTGSGKSSVAN